MRNRRTISFLMPLVLVCAIKLGAQDTAGTRAVPADSAANGVQAESGPGIFPLLPLMEAVFSGESRWRPDWPEDFPPDAFSLSGSVNSAGGDSAPSGKALVVELSNGTDSYTFRRDSAGRLLEFPFFSSKGLMKASAAYDDSGALRGLQIVTLAAASAADSPAADGTNAASADSAAGGETAWNIIFPQGFLLFSDNPGGDFPPLQVSSNGTIFFVLVHESPLLLTETWYDAQGNMTAFFKAPLMESGGRSFVQSLQTLDASNPEGALWRNEDYFFDSGGNTSEIRSETGVFSALYQNKRPRYWKRQIAAAGEKPQVSRLALQWDARWLLVNMRSVDEPVSVDGTADGTVSAPAEFRYEYELDAGGNWVKRRDVEVISQFGVFIPMPGKTWIRNISFTEYPAQLSAEE
jgi:hypothetical protein